MDELFREFNISSITPTIKPTAAGAKPSPAGGVVNKRPYTHPSMTVPHKIEKAFTESTTGKITEGCIKHYSERIVSTDETETEYISLLSEINLDDLEKYIIMGEILAPKFDR